MTIKFKECEGLKLQVKRLKNKVLKEFFSSENRKYFELKLQEFKEM